MHTMREVSFFLSFSSFLNDYFGRSPFKHLWTGKAFSDKVLFRELQTLQSLFELNQFTIISVSRTAIQ